MENTNYSNLDNNSGGEEAPFEFKNLLSEMFTSFPNQNPSSSSLERGNTMVKEASKVALPSSPSSTSSNSSSSSHNMISFGNPAESNFLGDEQDYDMMSVEKVMTLSSSTSLPKRISRSPLQSQDHLMAERKRRERFSQLFTSLAKTIPGLKKLDKASILEDSIKYIEQLQGRVRALEEAGTKRNLNIESTATPKQSLAAISDDETFLTKDIADDDCSMKSNPENEIKVQIVDKNVLIGIHCSNSTRNIFSLIAGTMEKLHLTIHNIRVTPFNHTALNIAILSQIDQNAVITVQDVEKAFELALFSTPNPTD